MEFTAKHCVLAVVIGAGTFAGTGRVFGAAVPLQNATATFDQNYVGGLDAAINGVANENGGWAIYDNDSSPTDPQTAVFETVTNTTAPSYVFTVSHLDSNSQHTIGKFRLSATTDDRSTFADGLNTGGDVTANWVELVPSSATATNGTVLTINPTDNTILASGPNPATSVYTITAPSGLSNVTGFRLEILTDPSLPDNGPGRAFNGNIVMTEFEVSAVPEPTSVCVLGLGAIGLLSRRRVRR